VVRWTAVGSGQSAVSGRARRAHTLTELLVVLTILAIFAVITLPRVASAVLRTRLDAALEAVRGDLNFARARAVSTGVRHQLVIDPSTGQVGVEPFRPEQLAVQTTSPTQPVSDFVLQDRLHESVQVAVWTVSPVGAALSSPGGFPTGAAGAPLVFYPEGTSDDAILILEDQQGSRRGLRVDGFSGEIREMEPEEMQQL
jgi:prepilin-type N-terminal cleavage/methylation domain-containing protein